MSDGLKSGEDAGRRPDSSPPTDMGRQVLDIVQTLAMELHPGRQAVVRADSSLDADLGFDSLSRVELLLRLENGFAISLPEQLLASAETPRDLIRAVHAAAGHADQRKPVDTPSVEYRPLPHHTGEANSCLAPSQAMTLPDVLEWHVQQHPEQTHVHLYGEHEQPEPVRYAELLHGARRMAAGLRDRDLQPAQCVAIMLATGIDYLQCFLGIQLAGGIPVPIYPPLRASQLEDHLRRHAGILANAQSVILITDARAQAVAQLLKARVESLHTVITPAQLAQDDTGFTGPRLQTHDIAFLQYTSGSTGQPKGVVLTHADVLANIRAMGEAIRIKANDVFVSWLPLYHDMGLIGAWLGSLYFAIPLVLMSPLSFLAHPQRWLWAIHQHGGTLSAAPNFAYELCASRITDSALQGLQLNTWRMAFNGAEPVSPHTLRHFQQRFAPYGLHADCMTPVYGLAEAAVGLAFPPPGRGPVIDRIQRTRFMRDGHAVPASAQDEDALAYVACGQPLPGYQLRVLDESGRELPDRQQGRLQFRGPSATSGYYRNPQATAALLDGDWRHTGDLAYIADGDVYLSSRIKDVIIRGGRNLFPYETEQAVGELAGIRKGCVAVFGATDSDSGTERVVILAESREGNEHKRAALRKQIVTLAGSLLGMPPDEVILAPSHTVLKTSSGKIRRSACRDLYLQGNIGRSPHSPTRQLFTLMLGSIAPLWRRGRRWLRDHGYALYVQTLFWLLAPLTWLWVVLTPIARWRWPVMRAAARLLLRLARIPLRVEGSAQLSSTRAAVLVVNHASYMDGLVLVASLPVEVSFVAKRELQQQMIPRLFLERIGVQFVERFDRRQGLADAQRLAQTADGRCQLYFPEGTFTRSPGLLPFRMGAFINAAESGLPVIPIALRGTRSLLRAGSWFPRRSALVVHVGEALMPTGDDWTAAVSLRDASRRAILRHAGEPELTHGVSDT